MSTATAYPHITIGPDGFARISGSRYKVLHLAGEHYQFGWTAEELLRQHPDLRPEEGYGALTYFYDNYAEMVEALHKQTSPSALQPRKSSLSRDELLMRRQNGNS
jgi:uncharacterized protein (DUF433 family)